MKILHINQIYTGYSTGRTVRDLGIALRKKGHTQLVAYSMGGKNFPHGYRIGGPINHKIHGLCSRVFGLQGYFSYLPTIRLLHYIHVTKPDVVHLSNLHGNYIHVNLLLKYLAKQDIATVVTLHDCWFYTGRCTHYSINQCNQWKKVCRKCPNENNTLKTWFFDRAHKMHKDKAKYFSQIRRLAVIGVSDWITNEAKKSILGNALIIDRIYNWVDLQIFHPNEEETLRSTLGAENKFIILSVASYFGPSKGLYEFIQLAKRLDPSKYLIILVGNIDTNVTLPRNIKHIPLVSNRSWLAKLYRVSDVFVSLSKEESFGKVIAESLACGTPVVTYNMTACPELVGKGCGYVAKSNTLKEIYKGIQIIKKNSKSYYTDNCYAYAKEHFNKVKNTNAYINVYKKLIYAK